MSKIQIKPLSVNRVWQGRRFKTPDYKAYEREMILLLPKKKIPQGRLFLRLTVGVSSKNSDIDNPVKPILDILQKKYLFNDKKIYLMEVEKVDVEKGEEFIDFDLSPLD